MASCVDERILGAAVSLAMVGSAAKTPTSMIRGSRPMPSRGVFGRG